MDPAKVIEQLQVELAQARTHTSGLAYEGLYQSGKAEGLEQAIEIVREAEPVCDVLTCPKCGRRAYRWDARAKVYLCYYIDDCGHTSKVLDAPDAPGKAIEIVQGDSPMTERGRQPDSSTLSQRLRETAEDNARYERRGEFGIPNPNAKAHDQIEREAADEIDRQQREIESLRQQLSQPNQPPPAV